MKILEKIKRIFSKETDLYIKNLKTIYAEDKKINSFFKYPFQTDLSDQGIHAKRMLFSISEENFEKIILIIKNNFEIKNTLLPIKNFQITNNLNETLNLDAWREFNSVMIDLISNSKKLLIDINQAPPPPAPWVVFPDIDANNLAVMQGGLAFWWNLYWSPFFDNLSLAEQDSYLASHDAPIAWINYIMFQRELANEA